MIWHISRGNGYCVCGNKLQEKRTFCRKKWRESGIGLVTIRQGPLRKKIDRAMKSEKEVQ